MKHSSPKRTGALLLAALLALLACGLSGCSRYRSSYSAVGFVHSGNSRSAFMNFHQFSGTMVFKLKCKDGQAGHIRYSARLEESGSATVYYDDGSGKTELFSIRAGEAFEASAGQFETGATVYVIVETDGKCESGEFHFDME